YTYNVGDAHVFYLPSHLILALLIAPGLVLAGDIAERLFPGRLSRTTAIAVISGIAIAAAAGRIYRDYPALDRSGDRRPNEVLAAMTRELDDRHAILLADLNWQLVDGLAYFGRTPRPALAYDWLARVLLYAPALIHDNFAIGREVALTPRARNELARAYGPLLPTVPDPRVQVQTIGEIARGLPQGTRYVLCVLQPTRDFSIDPTDLRAAVRLLTRGERSIPGGAYVAVAGLVGQQPAMEIGSTTPFRERVRVNGVPVEVRMESWLPFDTIRRMGFGQVVAARHHTLIVERGLSFATFDENGRPLRTTYSGNI